MIDKSLAERDADIDKMCTHIDKDIVALGKEVKEVKQKAQVSEHDKWKLIRAHMNITGETLCNISTK